MRYSLVRQGRDGPEAAGARGAVRRSYAYGDWQRGLRRRTPSLPPPVQPAVPQSGSGFTGRTADAAQSTVAAGSDRRSEARAGGPQLFEDRTAVGEETQAEPAARQSYATGNVPSSAPSATGGSSFFVFLQLYIIFIRIICVYLHKRISCLQYGSPYDPYTSCSPQRLQTTYTSGSTNNGNGGNGSNNGPTSLHQEATAVYVTNDTLPPLVSSGSTSLPTSTASYTRYEVVPSSYATTHAIRSSSSSSKVLTVDLPSPDSGIGADAVTPRQDHHQPTALHQVRYTHKQAESRIFCFLHKDE